MERLKKEKDVNVRITTTTDGETFITEGAGEYAHDDEAHYVAYTERDEHGSVTRSGLHIGREKLLLHRDGAVVMKMLFDPLDGALTLTRHTSSAGSMVISPACCGIST